MGRRIASKATLLAGLLALVMSGVASAAPTVVVQNGNDAGAGSLRQAILDVDPGGTIVIPASVGEITLTSGQLKIEESLTIEGAGATQTTIDASHKSRAISISGSPIVTIEGVQLIDGKVGGGPTENSYGGAIDQAGGSLTVVDSLITENEIATGAMGFPFGGGIAAEPGATSLTLRNTVVADNVVRGLHDWGGGVYVKGAPLTIEGGSVKANTAEGSSMFGGGIYFDGTRASLSRVAITGNELRPNGNLGDEGDGAGLEMEGGTGNTLEGVTIARNRATINNPTAENVTLIGGGALIAGAAIVNTTIANNSITENIEKDGTALAGGLGVTGPATIVNSTLVGNELRGEGTALQSEGGDLWVAARAEVENSIFAAGTVRGGGQNCAIQHPDGELISLGHNIDSLIQCAFHAAGDQSTVDPMVGPLAENGGPVETLALQPGSPATDAADAAGCPATDARGVLRPAGAACDIGAFEVATPTATTEGATDVGTDRATPAGAATNPDLAGGTVSFQYGTSTAYGSQTVPQAIGATTSGANFSAPVTGLKPGTTYHYRVVVTNAVATAVGADRTLTTQSPTTVVTKVAPAPLPKLSVKHLAGLRFRVACAGAPCNGKLVATARSGKRSVVIAKAKLKLPAGAAKKVTLKPTRAKKRLVALPARLPVVAKATLAGGKGSVPKPLHFKLR
jgi:hypothetical protein